MRAQAHTLLFLGVYAGILALPHTKWRDRLPAKPSFYRYVLVLFALNLLAGLGEALNSPGHSNIALMLCMSRSTCWRALGVALKIPCPPKADPDTLYVALNLLAGLGEAVSPLATTTWPPGTL